MSELALRSTAGTEFVEVDKGERIGAVRADGGEVEILGCERAGGSERRLRLRPTAENLGWINPPEDVAWTAFRAAEQGATCYLELVPFEEGA